MKYVVGLSLLLSAASTSACNVPVFRYALERWKADHSSIVVFHDNHFTAHQRLDVARLENASIDAAHNSNQKTIRQNVAAAMSDETATLWDELKSTDPKLPYVVVRSEVSGQTINNWRKSFDDTTATEILSSPARKELCERILKGHSAVWLVLGSTSNRRTKTVTDLLESELSKLSTKIPLPEGIGLPGSELFADIPLLMKFSVLQIDPADPQEAFLTELFRGFEPDAVNAGDPVVVPVFGRGRALEVIPASTLDAGLIEDLTLFLCGACSCQVKERNPGFDLLTSTNWDARLFGEDTPSSPEFELTVAKAQTEPELLEIPPGHKDATSSDEPVETKPERLLRQSSMLSLIIVLMVICIVALVAARRIDI